MTKNKYKNKRERIIRIGKRIKNMNIKKLVLTVADGSEKVLDFTADVNFTTPATTISKIVETLEDNTQRVIFPESGPVPSTDPITEILHTHQSGVTRRYVYQA